MIQFLKSFLTLSPIQPNEKIQAKFWLERHWGRILIRFFKKPTILTALVCDDPRPQIYLPESGTDQVFVRNPEKTILSDLQIAARKQFVTHDLRANEERVLVL